MFERDSVAADSSHAVHAAALLSSAASELIRLATCLQEFSSRRCAAEECCAQLARYLGASTLAVIRLAGKPVQDRIVCSSPAVIPGEAHLISSSRCHAEKLTADGEAMLIGSNLHGDCLLAALLESQHCRHILAVTGCVDRPALDAIMPMIRAAFLARERIDRCHSRLALTGVLLQQAENGLVMLDHEGFILYRNPAAEDQLATNSGISLRGARLFFDGRLAQDTLTQLFGALHNHPLPDSVTVHLPRERRQPLTLILVPVLMEPSGPLFAPRRGVMVVLHDPETRHVRATEHCRSTCNLTPSESRVLQEFCRNPQLSAIAGALGISPYTVKTHIVHICHKLGVHSRIELQRWLQMHPLPAEAIVIDRYPDFAAEQWNGIS